MQTSFETQLSKKRWLISTAGQIGTQGQMMLAITRVNRQLASALVQWDKAFGKLWQPFAARLQHYFFGAGIGATCEQKIVMATSDKLIDYVQEVPMTAVMVKLLQDNVQDPEAPTHVNPNADAIGGQMAQDGSMERMALWVLGLNFQAAVDLVSLGHSCGVTMTEVGRAVMRDFPQ